jgi:hypothetical protein
VAATSAANPASSGEPTPTQKFLELFPSRPFETGGRFSDPSEQASGRGLKTAEGLLLQAVSDRPNQKGPAETAGRLLAVEVFPALAEVRDAGLRKARNFVSERCSVGRQRPPLHDRFRPYLATTRSISKPMCGPPMSGRFTAPNDTHIARFASRSQSCEGDFGRYRAYQVSQLHFPFAFQSPWSRRPSMCADSCSFLCQ